MLTLRKKELSLGTASALQQMTPTTVTLCLSAHRILSFLPSPGTPTLGQSSKARHHESDEISSMDCWYPRVSLHPFTRAHPQRLCRGGAHGIFRIAKEPSGKADMARHPVKQSGSKKVAQVVEMGA